MNEIPIKVKDKTSKRFGRLIVKEFAGINIHGRADWFCDCDCGTKKKKISSLALASGNTKSCGCLAKEAKKKNRFKHGGAKKGKHERFYDRWAAMKERCYRKNHPSYEHYGGRNITVCQEWHDYENFREWAENSGFQEGMQIDRIDNDKGYSPENCRWATVSQNQSNKRSNNLVEINGVTKTLTQWADESGISFFSLRSRQVRGWKPEQLLLPIGTKRKDL